jgi:uncharacterized protein (DUF4415 family)
MNIKKTKNADIRSGKRDILKNEDFEAKNVRHRISIVVPEDVLMRFKQMSQETGLGYQTIMNQVLREASLSRSGVGTVGDRLEKLEREVFRHRKTGT